MNSLPKNLAEVREYLSRIRPWAAVAMLGAIVLLAFYTFQALQYWEAWNDTKTMNQDIERISRKLDKGVPRSENVSEKLASFQERRQYLRSLYHYPDTAGLMGIISSTSWDAGVDLPSISAGDPTLQNIDGMKYRVQPLSLTMRGTTPDIYRFLSTLHQKVKVLSVPGVNISSPGAEETTAQVQLNFYLSPEPITGEEGAD